MDLVTDGQSPTGARTTRRRSILFVFGTTLFVMVTLGFVTLGIILPMQTSSSVQAEFGNTLVPLIASGFDQFSEATKKELDTRLSSTVGLLENAFNIQGPVKALSVIKSIMPYIENFDFGSVEALFRETIRKDPSIVAIGYRAEAGGKVTTIGDKSMPDLVSFKVSDQTRFAYAEVEVFFSRALLTEKIAQETEAFGRIHAQAVEARTSLVDTMQSDMDRIRKDLTASLGRRIWFFAAVTCLAVIGLSMYQLRKIVTVPLNATKHRLLGIADGNLAGQGEISATGELGEMAEAMAIMEENLRNMIGGISSISNRMTEISADIATVSGQVSQGASTQSESVASASTAMESMNDLILDVTQRVDALAESAEHTSSSATEMSASIGEVATSAEALASLTDEISSSIEEMSTSITQVSANIGDLSHRITESSASTSEVEASARQIEEQVVMALRLSDQVTASVTEDGMKSVHMAVDGFNRIAEAVGEATEVITVLRERSATISEIIGVIHGITDQTNLLSLNASILAAQAGENGKGFAVVAEEIGSLAERTAISTKKIEKMIAGVQSETEKAVQTMTRGSRLVEEGAALVEVLKKTLNQVADDSRKASEASAIIARATSEQVAGTRLISMTSREMADTATQIARATEEQSRASSEVVRAVTDMRDQATKVKKSMIEQSLGTRVVADAGQKSRDIALRISEATRQEVERSMQIIQAIEEVRDVAARNRTVVEQLNTTVETLAQQSAALRVQVARFRVEHPDMDYERDPSAGPTDVIRRDVL